jgi:hypothetical protein
MSDRDVAINHLSSLMIEAFNSGRMGDAIEYEHTLTLVEEMSDAEFADLYPKTYLAAL